MQNQYGSRRRKQVAKALGVLGAVVGMGALSGCANLPGWSVPQAVDEQKIALVDSWAARNNVTVIWVNQPRRSKPEVPPAPSS